MEEGKVNRANGIKEHGCGEDSFYIWDIESRYWRASVLHLGYRITILASVSFTFLEGQYCIWDTESRLWRAFVSHLEYRITGVASIRFTFGI